MSAHALLSEGQILTGPLFSEPMRVETVRSNGAGAWVAGLVGLRSERFRRVTLNSDDIAALAVADATLSYDGDARLLRLSLLAWSLGIAFEFDPYFGLSISRVDPLPHQLAVEHQQVVLGQVQSADGCIGIQATMRPVPVVPVQPERQLVGALR